MPVLLARGPARGKQWPACGGKRRGGGSSTAGASLRACWPACLLVACALSAPTAQRAALLADRGQVGQAVALLERHLLEHERDVAERRLLIRLYAGQGRGDAALAQTERLAEALPSDSPLPWIELGYVHELGHDYSGALEAYDRAAEVAPRSAEGPKRGGLRAARWGEFQLAETRLEEAARRDPRDPAIWHALGFARMQLGEWPSAEQAYGAGLDADPTALENRLGLATVALQRNQPGLALEQYDRIISVRHGHADAWLGRSWCLLLLGRMGEARAALEQAASRGGSPDVIQRQRAAIQAKRGGAAWQRSGPPMPDAHPSVVPSHSGSRLREH